MEDSERLSERAGEVAKRLIADAPRRAPRNPDPVRWDQEDARVRQEWLEAKAAVLLQSLPPTYRAASLPDSQEGRKAFTWVQNYRAGERRTLTIIGPVGSGKTWLAAAITRELLLRGAPAPGGPRGKGVNPVPVRFVSLGQLLDSLRPGEGQVDVESYALPPVLVLDDLGTERLTDWEKDRLFSLVYARVNAGLPNIITTNLAPAALKERYEPRTYERLFAGSEVIVLTGESRRPLPEGF